MFKLMESKSTRDEPVPFVVGALYSYTSNSGTVENLILACGNGVVIYLNNISITYVIPNGDSFRNDLRLLFGHALRRLPKGTSGILISEV